MSIDFFNTAMGRTFYESTAPEIARQLKRVADTMTVIAQQSAASASKVAVETDAHAVTSDQLKELRAGWSVQLTSTDGKCGYDWELRLSRPQSRTFIYRGALNSIIARAHAGEPGDADRSRNEIDPD